MDADPRLENRVGFFMAFTTCSDRVSWSQSVGAHQEIFTSDTPTASGRYPVNFVDPMGLAIFLPGGNLGGGAGQDYDPASIPYNSAVNSITAGPGSVQKGYGMFDLFSDGATAVAAGTTIAVAAPIVSEAALYVASTSPFEGLVLTTTISGGVGNAYIGNTGPATMNVGQMINAVGPYAGQFISGIVPGPGGPFANKGEVASWLAGTGAAYLSEQGSGPCK
jgi:hypothetical protein